MTPSILDKLADQGVVVQHPGETKGDKWGPASSEDLLAIMGGRVDSPPRGYYRR